MKNIPEMSWAEILKVNFRNKTPLFRADSILNFEALFKTFTQIKFQGITFAYFLIQYARTTENQNKIFVNLAMFESLLR